MVLVFLNLRYKFCRSFFCLIVTRNFSFSKWFRVIFLKDIITKTNFLSHASQCWKTYFCNSLTFNMTYVYCRVDDMLSVCIKITSSCIQKKNLKLSKAQLSKLVSNNVPLTVQWFENNVLPPELPVFSQPIGSSFPF